jgi:hypothetical protein
MLGFWCQAYKERKKKQRKWRRERERERERENRVTSWLWLMCVFILKTAFQMFVYTAWGCLASFFCYNYGTAVVVEYGVCVGSVRGRMGKWRKRPKRKAELGLCCPANEVSTRNIWHEAGEVGSARAHFNA